MQNTKVSEDFSVEKLAADAFNRYLKTKSSLEEDLVNFKKHYQMYLSLESQNENPEEGQPNFKDLSSITDNKIKKIQQDL